MGNTQRVTGGERRIGWRRCCRDRQVKLKLYSSRGVLAYWIVDWLSRQVSVYRRTERTWQLTVTLYPQDRLPSPLLPGFACPVTELLV
ncbi:MAG: Uma2 family endonuclease [Gloeomargarita sp. GMQP_bins_120]